jgi:hypothetical protein
MESLLKITPEFYDSDCGECGCGTYSGLNVQQTTLADEISKMSDYHLHQLGLVRVKPDVNKEFDKLAVTTLKQHGWVHAANATTRAEKKVLEQKFWILNENGKAYAYYDPKFAALDLDDLPDELIKRLAEGAEIVQKVTAKSVLKDKDYKRLKEVQAKKAEAAKKAAETKKLKAEAKKLKQIEEAKKLLEEAGELKQ